jgi:two-component system, OmpR family, sensor histidine kinase MprB
MTVRAKVTLLSALAMTALAVVTVVLLYIAESRDLRGQVDTDLRTRGEALSEELLQSGEVEDLLRPPFGAPLAYAQLVRADGEIVPLAPGTPEFPVSPQDQQVAEGEAESFFQSLEVGDVHIRLLTMPVRPGLALQVARPVDEIDLHLLHLAAVSVLIAVAGCALGVLLGRWVAHSALRPVAQLTEAAELVASTHDLAHRIEVAGDPELVRLADSMNSMVAALDEAVNAQHQLVADASHELQTPLTVLRTNITLLQKAPDMPEAERELLLSDIEEELRSLSRLSTNLVDLARGSSDPATHQEVALEAVTGDLIAEARRAYPGIRWRAHIDEHSVRGDPDQVRRLVRNLLDNAAVWAGPNGAVEVDLRDGVLTVRDHGPGIASEDLPHLFERFYRATSARSMPGAGLGLAIVAKAASEHGWTVRADNAEGGGARFRVFFEGEPIATEPRMEDETVMKPLGVSGVAS